MVVVGSSWVEINYWSNSIGNGVSAQIRLLGKSTQNVSANASRIDYKWQKRLTGSGSAYNNNTQAYSMTMTGHSASWNMVLGTVSTTSWVDIGETGDYWSDVVHNADGTCTVNYTATGYRFNGTAFSESGTFTLPTIARASRPTVTPDPLTVGDALTINTNRASSSFTHTITLAFDSFSTTIRNVGTTAMWDASEQYMMPYMDTWEKTVTVTCVTYNGSTVIGTTTTTFKLRVDTTKYKPVITFGTATDADSTTAALETAGSFIKGYSQISIPVSARVNLSTYGETIKKISVTLGEITQEAAMDATSGTLNFLATVSTATLTATATDSRGYSVTSTKTLTLIEYEPITLSSVNLERVNQNGDPTETGDYLRYTITGTAFLGSFGQANNHILIGSTSKLATDTSYGPWITEQNYITSGSGAVAEYAITGITVGTYVSSQQYDVVFGLQDALSPASSGAIRVHEGVPVFSWGPDFFDIYGQLHIHSREDVSNSIAIDHNGGGLSGILRTQWFTSASVSCAANWASSVSIAVTVPDGYTYVGVISTCSNGNIIPCYCNTGALVGGQATVWWRNPTGSALTATFSVNVLFIRT